MPSIRLELFKGKKLLEEYFPICVTVTNKGKVRRKSISSATVDQWDAKAKPHARIKPRSRKDHERVNREIEEEYLKYLERYRTLKDSGYEWEPEDVFKEQELVRTAMFKENAQAYIDSLTNAMTKDGIRSIVDKILRFTKDKDFDMNTISERWIADFRKHCLTQEFSNKGKDKDGKPIMGNSENTIMLALKKLKRIAAFADVENKALKRTKISFKDALLSYPTIDDFKALQDVKLIPGINRWHALNIFSIQIYLRGMRIGDALQLEWSDIVDGRLEYNSQKTGHSYNMEIPPVAMKILEHYKEQEGKYIFPFFKWEYNKRLSPEENAAVRNMKIKAATSLVNNNLKKLSANIGITRTITTHQARHMYAIWADELLKGDLSTVQRLLGHKTRAMTEKYIKRLRHVSELDDAALKVLGGIG